MVQSAGSVRALVIDLGDGDQWWSTRLYLLASLVRALTNVQQLVFRGPKGQFAGMASPAAVVDGAKCADARGALFPPRPDRRRMALPELHRRLSEWLRCAAIRELIASGLIYQYCSPKLQL